MLIVCVKDGKVSFAVQWNGHSRRSLRHKPHSVGKLSALKTDSRSLSQAHEESSWAAKVLSD